MSLSKTGTTLTLVPKIAQISHLQNNTDTSVVTHVRTRRELIGSIESMMKYWIEGGSKMIEKMQSWIAVATE